MNNFKPKKSQAILNASTQVLHQKAEKVIELLEQAHPELGLALSVIHAGFGIGIAYKQEKLNQFTQFLMDNQNTFSKSMIETREFQDGMEVFLESYFKLRSKEKLKLAQNIFLDFSKALEKPTYPLERYNDTLEKISPSGVQFLGFMRNEIPKLKLEYTELELEKHKDEPGYRMVREHKSIDELIKTFCSPHPLNFFIEQYIEKLTAEKMKSFKGDDIKRIERKAKINNEFREPFSMVQGELEQLGLAKGSTVSTGYGPGEHHFNLNDYGQKFASIVKPEELHL